VTKRRVITIRHMAASELDRLGEIDRSEHVAREYSYRDGRLEARVADIAVPGWSPTGDHEHSVPSRIAAWRPLLDEGGTLVGAFDADAIAGVAIYRPHLTPRVANLAVLHVSRSHRRMGVASLLTDEVARLARADGARRLYVSATPSDSAVGFYRSYGFEPIDEPNEALFALEPEDIHMILEL
jgi:ribosomal protein S18 acetylase RimI-like enzyme